MEARVAAMLSVFCPRTSGETERHEVNRRVGNVALALVADLEAGGLIERATVQ